MKSQNRNIFDTFENFGVVSAIICLILLVFAYFGIPSFSFISQDKRDFLQSVITNLIPSLLVFILAYALFYRRFQRLRSEEEAENLSKKIANEVVNNVVLQKAETDRSTEIDRIINLSRNIIYSTKFSWLYHANDILAVEKAIVSKEIWIASPHLLNDTGTLYETTEGAPSTVATGQENLRRGIKYTFIVPETSNILRLIPQLTNNYMSPPGMLHIIKIHPSDFQNLTISDVVIYNPHSENGRPPRVFMELPIVTAHTYWIELIDDVANEYVDRFQKIINEISKQ